MSGSQDPVLPSGRQYEIRCGEQRATIVEVGGGIRVYDHGDRHVLEPYESDAMCDGGHGAPLIPWPNRVAHGSYRFAGEEHRLPLSEPAQGNAIHGLLRWRGWSLLEQEEDHVCVGIRLHPQTGWPFPLDVSIDYALDEHGLRVRTEVVNIGGTDAPLAVGQHPYLWPGGEAVDRATLSLPAQTRLLLDGEHALPAGCEPVAGSDYDFRAGRPVGALQLDDAFTDLERDDDGRARARLTGADRRTVELWVDQAYPVIQVFSGDTLATARRRTGLAVEAMSAPANALRTGDRLVVLAPGRTWAGSWGVSLKD